MLNKVRFFFTKEPMRNISLAKVDKVFEAEYREKVDTVDKIIKFNPSNIDFVTEDERAFPGDKRFFDSGYYITMLKRYFFAGKNFCENKLVLDSCCGLGWGTYIILQYAQHIDAFDFDSRVVDYCKRQWPSDKVSWYVDDAVYPKNTKKSSYDAVLGMETIEHFSKEDGEKYVRGMAEALKDGGYFIGTSGFPKTKEQASEVLRKNKYHLYIHTEGEMKTLLKKILQVLHNHQRMDVYR